MNYPFSPLYITESLFLAQWQDGIRISLNSPFKATVQQYFIPPIFFIKLLVLVPIVMP
jgi:hypothetical protein